MIEVGEAQREADEPQVRMLLRGVERIDGLDVLLRGDGDFPFDHLRVGAALGGQALPELRGDLARLVGTSRGDGEPRRGHEHVLLR